MSNSTRFRWAVCLIWIKWTLFKWKANSIGEQSILVRLDDRAWVDRLAVWPVLECQSVIAIESMAHPVSMVITQSRIEICEPNLIRNNCTNWQWEWAETISWSLTDVCVFARQWCKERQSVREMLCWRWTRKDKSKVGLCSSTHTHLPLLTSPQVY